MDMSPLSLSSSEGESVPFRAAEGSYKQAHPVSAAQEFQALESGLIPAFTELSAAATGNS